MGWGWRLLCSLYKTKHVWMKWWSISHIKCRELHTHLIWTQISQFDDNWIFNEACEPNHIQIQQWRVWGWNACSEIMYTMLTAPLTWCKWTQIKLMKLKKNVMSTLQWALSSDGLALGSVTTSAWKIMTKFVSPFYTGLALNTLMPRQNGHHLPDNILKSIFLNENVWISLKIWLKFVLNVWINNIPVLVQIMEWHWSGNKPLSRPMMVSLLTHICITRPQWLNEVTE